MVSQVPPPRRTRYLRSGTKTCPWGRRRELPASPGGVGPGQSKALNGVSGVMRLAVSVPENDV
jgi:hypothetical protein